MFQGKLFLMGRCSGIYYLYNYFFITEATILYIFFVFALEKAKHMNSKFKILEIHGTLYFQSS